MVYTINDYRVICTFSVPIFLLFLTLLYVFEGDKTDVITSEVDFTLESVG